jgi:hypothetical protein
VGPELLIRERLLPLLLSFPKLVIATYRDRDRDGSNKINAGKQEERSSV